MDVIVIGAGLSGLTAAVLLRDSGADVRVIEAAPRIGGRIHALRDPETGCPLADLGPTWVWPPYQPVAARWLERLGAETHPQFNTGDAVITGYGPSPMRQPLPGQDGMVRITGGPSTLIDSLAAQIGPARIRLSAPARAVCEDGPARIAVHLVSGEVLTACHVVLATPLRLAATTLDLPWAPEALRAAMRATPTWMSGHAKAVALYPQPFWREAGLSGRIASRTGPLVEAHDHSAPSGAPGAIFGFVGWPPAQRRADPHGLRRAILDQLVACFGPQAVEPLDLLVQDWADAPLITTDLDLTGPAAHPEIGPALLREAFLGGRLHLAVSEAADVSPGLIEGAFVAAERAVQRIAALGD